MNKGYTSLSPQQFTETYNMSLEINYSQMLSRFDDLATKGLIHYAPPKTVRLSENGFTASTH